MTALLDSMYLDGLEDAYEPGRLMGSFAEETARRYQLTRTDQDAFALESLGRARKASGSRRFRPRRSFAVDGEGQGRRPWSNATSSPPRADPPEIPALKPAFAEDGTDHRRQRLLHLGRRRGARADARLAWQDARGMPVVARVVAHAAHAQAPAEFTTAPVPAIREGARRVPAGRADDVDLFEINEAFAVVAMIAMRELGIPRDRLNVNGGACALGHPIGASGRAHPGDAPRGARARPAAAGASPSLCIGGGEAIAMAVERAVEPMRRRP